VKEMDKNKIYAINEAKDILSFIDNNPNLSYDQLREKMGFPPRKKKNHKKCGLLPGRIQT
jgi:hypothetical protein